VEAAACEVVPSAAVYSFVSITDAKPIGDVSQDMTFSQLTGRLGRGHRRDSRGWRAFKCNVPGIRVAVWVPSEERGRCRSSRARKCRWELAVAEEELMRLGVAGARTGLVPQGDAVKTDGVATLTAGVDDPGGLRRTDQASTIADTRPRSSW
jgi:hypothetical protein